MRRRALRYLQMQVSDSFSLAAKNAEQQQQNRG
jgi:hypothetical protein